MSPAQQAANIASIKQDQRSTGERGVRLQGDGGFDECWYPIALSSEVEKGKIVSAEFLDGRVVAFRGEDGVASVVSPFCRHLGADLAVGEVIGNEIRCPFHHWKYDKSGMCSHIPSGDPIPKTAKLFNYPTVEKWGLVWAFNGDTPHYDVPYFTDDEADLTFHTAAVIEQNQDPFMLLSNSVDFQHLRFVHGLEFESSPKDIKFADFTLEYPMAFIDPNMGKMEQFIRVFGSNCITLSGSMMGMPTFSMFAGRPVSGNKTLGYTVSATRTDAGPAEQLNAIIDGSEKFFQGLIEDDTPIQDKLRFRPDQMHLVSADDALASFFAYLRKLPRSHPSQDYIR